MTTRPVAWILGVALVAAAGSGCSEGGSPSPSSPDEAGNFSEAGESSAGGAGAGEPGGASEGDEPQAVSRAAGFDRFAPSGALAAAGGAAGEGPQAIVAPYGVSTQCGDAIVGAEEECDDGAGGASDACASDCQTRDQPVGALGGGPPMTAERYLGAGRHPVSGLNDGFITVFVDAGGEEPAVAAKVFDIWGHPSQVVTVSGGASPISEANPVAAALPGGRYAIAWSDFDSDGSDLGVALRLVEQDGTLGVLRSGNSRTDFSQLNPDAVWTGSELVVAWEDYSDAANGPDLRFRTFDADLNATSADQALAGTPLPEAAVSLTRFNGSWAAAYREGAVSGAENIVVRSGGSTFRIGPLLGGPLDDRPALAELDSTHLLVVTSFGTDPLPGSGVHSVPRLAYAIVDTESTAALTLQPLDPMDELFTANALVSHSRPALARAEDAVYLTWRSEARPGDAAGDQIWVKRVTWNPMATPSKLGLGEPEFLVPRACEGSFGDQRAPALATVPLPPHGAVAFAWDDYGQTQGAGTGQPEVVVHYAPVHPRGAKFLKETWTATNGAPWPARWSFETQPVPSTVPTTIDVNLNAGRVAGLTGTTSGKARAWINDELALNVETKVRLRLSASNMYGGLIARRADEDSDSYFRAVVSTATEPLKLEAVIDGGAPTVIASLPTPYLFYAYIQGLDLFLKFRVVTNADSSVTLSAKVWLADLPEPYGWMLVGTVPGSGASTIRDRLGVRSGRFGLFAEQKVTSRTATFDDFQAMFYPGAEAGTLDSDQRLPPFPRNQSADACCDSNDECAAGMQCSASMSEHLHLGSNQTTCVPTHCTNNQLDTGLGETGVDCGGPDCGACSCTRAARTCSLACPCGIGQGDCGSSDVCLSGLVCRQVGWRYGLPTNEDDVCAPFHCFNRVQDSDKGELGPDWGGECGLRCDPTNVQGSQAHCTVSCPCGTGGGDCDADDECEPGMLCSNKGPNFGTTVNVCIKPHCLDKTTNFGETGVDCGGADCGACL